MRILDVMGCLARKNRKEDMFFVRLSDGTERQVRGAGNFRVGMKRYMVIVYGGEGEEGISCNTALSRMLAVIPCYSDYDEVAVAEALYVRHYDPCKYSLGTLRIVSGITRESGGMCISCGDIISFDRKDSCVEYDGKAITEGNSAVRVTCWYGSAFAAWSGVTVDGLVSMLGWREILKPRPKNFHFRGGEESVLHKAVGGGVVADRRVSIRI